MMKGLTEALDFFVEHYIRVNMTTTLNYSTTTFQIDANLGFINALFD